MKKLITVLLLICSFSAYSQMQPAPAGTLTPLSTNQAYFRASDSTYYFYNGVNYLWNYFLNKQQADKLYQAKNVPVPLAFSLSTGYGLSGSSFNGSAARTFTADTTSATGLVSKSRLTANLLGYVPTARILTINGTAQDLSANRIFNVGTVTSVASTAGTGISVSGSPITSSGTLTITNTLPDQTVVLTSGTGISATGTYPNFTITNTSPSSGGTVTNVSALTLGTTGTDLSSSVATGTTTPVITLNVPTASAANRGALSAADWSTFNGKQAAYPGLQDSISKKANKTFDNVASGAIANAKLANSTISGVSLGSNLSNLSAGTGLSFTAYNGSAAIVANADTAALRTTANSQTLAQTQTALNLKANLASPTFTGAPLAPTASPGTNTTQLATTAFVTAAVSASPSGTVTSVSAITLGTSGSDLSSTVANSTTTPVITLNVPTASASNRGVVSAADWSTFNGKQATLSGTGIVKSTGGTISYLTDPLPIANGGTGSASQNFVDLTTTQSIGGAKTFSADVQIPAIPTNATSAASKSYIDNLITGITWKAAVKAGTTANITLSGAQTIDGYSALAGDRILVKNQTTQANNGIYLVASGSWTRTTDADTGAELETATVAVTEGTINGDTQWTCTTASINLGVTAITFGQISGAGTYSASTGLTLTGNVFAIDGTVATLSGVQTITSKTIVSPALTGVPTAPTATVGTNNTQVATTAYADASANTKVSSVTGSGNIASSGGTTPNITFTGILPVANGGSGSSSQNFVDLTTAQTIAGVKTFSSGISATGGTGVGVTSTTSTSSAFNGTSSGGGEGAYLSSASGLGANINSTTGIAGRFTNAGSQPTLSVVNNGSGLLQNWSNIGGLVASMSNTGVITAPSFSGSLTGNASTATVLQTSRSINGVSFNGSADITITASPTSGTAVTSITGTTNQITVTGTTTPVISLPATITGLTSVTSTGFTGTINTAAQPNITSVGTLTGLSVNDNLFLQNGGTAIRYTKYSNTGGNYYIGADNSAGTGLFVSGGLPYALSIVAESARAVILGTNNIARYTIDASGNNTWTGTGTFGNGTAAAGLLRLNQPSNDITGGLLLQSSGGDNGGLYHNGTDLVVREGGINVITFGSAAVTSAVSLTAPTFIGALTGNASTATTAGTVTTAAQPAITSVGTLTGLTSSGIIAANSAANAANGSINIENSDPTLRFRVTGGTANKRIYEWRAIAAGGTNDYLQLRLWNDAQSSSTELLQINSAGSLSGTSLTMSGAGTFGTTVAPDKLNVAGNFSFYNTAGDGVANVLLGKIGARVRNYGTTTNASFANISFLTDPVTWSKGLIAFSTNNVDGTDGNNPPTERMRIASDGNVGIGTTAPRQKLEIVGDIALTTSSALGAYYKQSVGAANDYLGIGYFNVASSNDWYPTAGVPALTVKYTGNIGIGTTAPATKLDVNGTGRFTSALTLDNTLSVLSQSALGQYDGGAQIPPTATYALTVGDIASSGKSIDASGRVNAGSIVLNGIIRLKNYTVATLPAGTRGDSAYVTDATVVVAKGIAPVGGGVAVAVVFYNGTIWVGI